MKIQQFSFLARIFDGSSQTQKENLCLAENFIKKHAKRQEN